MAGECKFAASVEGYYGINDRWSAVETSLKKFEMFSSQRFPHQKCRRYNDLSNHQDCNRLNFHPLLFPLANGGGQK